MDENARSPAEEADQDAYTEAVERGESKLRAHIDAVVAAAMPVSAMTGTEDETAKQVVLELVLPSAKLRQLPAD